MKLLGLPRFELALVAEGAIPLATPLAGCSASEVAEFLHRTVGRPAREQLSVLLLDGRKRVIGYHLAFSGTLGRAPVEPYGVFVPALLANASFVLLCHGHPTVAPRGAQGESHRWMASYGADEWLRRQARGPEVDPRLKPSGQRGRGAPYRPEGCQPE